MCIRDRGDPQQHHQAPLLPQPTPTGFSNSIPLQGGPPSGRMGMGIGVNRNGNNHINHSMAMGYASLQPDGLRTDRAGGGYSHYESNHFSGSEPPTTQDQANFSTNHPPSLTQQPQTGKSISQPLHYVPGGIQPNLDPRSPHGDFNGRTTRGGFRQLAVEHTHPYSRPLADPHRHRGGWR